MTGDPWVLSVVQGVQIPFMGKFGDFRIPYPFKLGIEERLAMGIELARLREKGIICQSEGEVGQVISNVFLRPKPDGQYRLILDLTELNKWIPYEHFKMFSLQTAVDMMRPGCWMGSVDLKDAYYSVAIAKEFRKFLSFQWEGKLYHFVGMPNGLACAPRVFTKLLSPLYATLREQGHECFPYIDDSFVVGDSKEECQESVDRLCSIWDSMFMMGSRY